MLHSLAWVRYNVDVPRLVDSGVLVGCVVLNGKQYEPDYLGPLLKDLAEKHTELDIEKENELKSPASSIRMRLLPNPEGKGDSSHESC